MKISVSRIKLWYSFLFLLDNEEKTGQFNPVQFAFPFSFFPIIRTQFPLKSLARKNKLRKTHSNFYKWSQFLLDGSTIFKIIPHPWLHCLLPLLFSHTQQKREIACPLRIYTYWIFNIKGLVWIYDLREWKGTFN